MSNSTAAPTTTAPSPRRSLGVLADVGVLVLAAGILAATVIAAPPNPSRVAELRVDNPTAFEIGIEVRGSGRGWMPVSWVGPGATRQVEAVIDQGETWTFRFSGQGRAAGELTMTRAELDAGGWRLTVPDRAGAMLAASGAPPSPRRS